MEVYNRESALRHLNSFDVRDDFKSYKYGHVLKIHIDGKKKQLYTASSLKSRFVNLSDTEANNIVTVACRKFAKAIKSVYTPGGFRHYKEMCDTKIHQRDEVKAVAMIRAAEVGDILNPHRSVTMTIPGVKEDVYQKITEISTQLGITVAKLLQLLLDSYLSQLIKQPNSSASSTPTEDFHTLHTGGTSEESGLMEIDSDAKDEIPRTDHHNTQSLVEIRSADFIMEEMDNEDDYPVIKKEPTENDIELQPTHLKTINVNIPTTNTQNIQSDLMEIKSEIVEEDANTISECAETSAQTSAHSPKTASPQHNSNIAKMPLEVYPQVRIIRNVAHIGQERRRVGRVNNPYTLNVKIVPHGLTRIKKPKIKFVLAEGKVTFRLQASAEEFKDILRRMFPILSEEFTLLKCEPYGGKAGGGHLIPLEQYQSVADIKRQMHRGVLYVRLNKKDHLLMEQRLKDLEATNWNVQPDENEEMNIDECPEGSQSESRVNHGGITISQSKDRVSHGGITISQSKDRVSHGGITISQSKDRVSHVESKADQLEASADDIDSRDSVQVEVQGDKQPDRATPSITTTPANCDHSRRGRTVTMTVKLIPHNVERIIPKMTGVIGETKLIVKQQISLEEFSALLREAFPVLYREDYTLMKCMAIGNNITVSGQLRALANYRTVLEIKQLLNRGFLYVRLNAIGSLQDMQRSDEVESSNTEYCSDQLETDQSDDEVTKEGAEIDQLEDKSTKTGVEINQSGDGIIKVELDIDQSEVAGADTKSDQSEDEDSENDTEIDQSEDSASETGTEIDQSEYRASETVTQLGLSEDEASDAESKYNELEDSASEAGSDCDQVEDTACEAMAEIDGDSHSEDGDSHMNSETDMIDETFNLGDENSHYIADKLHDIASSTYHQTYQDGKCSRSTSLKVKLIPHETVQIKPKINTVLAETKVVAKRMITAEEFKAMVWEAFPILEGDFTLMKCLPYSSKGMICGELVALTDCNTMADIKQQINRGVLYVRMNDESSISNMMCLVEPQVKRKTVRTPRPHNYTVKVKIIACGTVVMIAKGNSVLAEAKVSVNKLISTTEFKDILVDTFPSLKGEFTLMKRLPFSKGEGGQLVALVDCNAISDIKQQLNRSALYVRLNGTSDSAHPYPHLTDANIRTVMETVS